MKNKYIIPVGLLVFVVAGYFGVKNVSAYGIGLRSDTFIAALASKLGISEEKVQSALDEIETDRHKEMQSRYEEYLTKAVADGKISEEQKNKIMEYHNEMVKNREAGRERHREFREWLEKEGIDSSLFFGLGGKGMGRGMYR